MSMTCWLWTVAPSTLVRFEAADFIANQLNRQTGERNYDYLDLYMGTNSVSRWADLTTVYEMIFRRLKEQQLSWRYRFPKLGLVEIDSSDKPDGARTLEIEKAKADLRNINRQAIEDAKEDPVPATVLAYQRVYGTFPTGWPPWQFDNQDD